MNRERQALVAGVDEAGRGPLAGPVVAAVVILDPARPISGLADSKQLSEKKREELAASIRRDALAFAVASASREEIDRLNVLAATLLAMRRSIQALPIMPDSVLVDGNRLPDLEFDGVTLPGRAEVRGDSRIDAISAASILAKTSRDRIMRQLDLRYPDYGFARHKGYGTAFHLEQLRRLGPCDEHRRSFAPVRAVA